MSGRFWTAGCLLAAVVPATSHAERGVVRVGARHSSWVPQSIVDLQGFDGDFSDDDNIDVTVTAEPTWIRTFEASVQLNRAWRIGATYMGTDDFSQLRRLAGQLGYEDSTLRVEHGQVPYRVSDNRGGRAFDVNGNNPAGPVKATSLRSTSSYTTVQLLFHAKHTPGGARLGPFVTRYVAPAFYRVEAPYTAPTPLGVSYLVDMETTYQQVGVVMQTDVASRVLASPHAPVTRWPYACRAGGRFASTCFGLSGGITLAMGTVTPSNGNAPEGGRAKEPYPRRFWAPMSGTIELGLGLAHTVGPKRRLFLHYGAEASFRMEYADAPHAFRLREETRDQKLAQKQKRQFTMEFLGPLERLEYGPYFEAGARF